MSIQFNGSSYQTAVNANQAQQAQQKASSEEEQAAAKKEDAFEKSPAYKTDRNKVAAMKADLAGNVAAFKQMVQNLIQRQGGFATNAMNALMKIDQGTQLAAQEAISEDGEWGVNKTAERILEFAKALTGGDPSKAETMRDAINAGFAAAEKVWGGRLPGICYQTQEKIMQGLDEWKNGGTTETPSAS